MPHILVNPDPPPEGAPATRICPGSETIVVESPGLQRSELSSEVVLLVGGAPVVLNPFVQKVLWGTIQGMVDALHGGETGEEIWIRIPPVDPKL